MQVYGHRSISSLRRITIRALQSAARLHAQTTVSGGNSVWKRSICWYVIQSVVTFLVAHSALLETSLKEGLLRSKTILISKVLVWDQNLTVKCLQYDQDGHYTSDLTPVSVSDDQ